jgi:hypothetical protein
MEHSRIHIHWVWSSLNLAFILSLIDEPGHHIEFDRMRVWPISWLWSILSLPMFLALLGCRSDRHPESDLYLWSTLSLTFIWSLIDHKSDIHWLWNCLQSTYHLFLARFYQTHIVHWYTTGNIITNALNDSYKNNNWNIYEINISIKFKCRPLPFYDHKMFLLQRCKDGNFVFSLCFCKPYLYKCLDTFRDHHPRKQWHLYFEFWTLYFVIVMNGTRMYINQSK